MPDQRIWQRKVIKCVKILNDSCDDCGHYLVYIIIETFLSRLLCPNTLYLDTDF